jgi:hypothetical protein
MRVLRCEPCQLQFVEATGSAVTLHNCNACGAALSLVDTPPGERGNKLQMDSLMVGEITKKHIDFISFVAALIDQVCDQALDRVIVAALLLDFICHRADISPVQVMEFMTGLRTPRSDLVA